MAHDEAETPEERRRAAEAYAPVASTGAGTDWRGIAEDGATVAFHVINGNCGKDEVRELAQRVYAAWVRAENPHLPAPPDLGTDWHRIADSLALAVKHLRAGTLEPGDPIFRDVLWQHANASAHDDSKPERICICPYPYTGHAAHEWTLDTTTYWCPGRKEAAPDEPSGDDTVFCSVCEGFGHTSVRRRIKAGDAEITLTICPLCCTKDDPRVTCPIHHISHTEAPDETGADDRFPHIRQEFIALGKMPTTNDFKWLLAEVHRLRTAHDDVSDAALKAQVLDLIDAVADLGIDTVAMNYPPGDGPVREDVRVGVLAARLRAVCSAPVTETQGGGS